MTIKNACGRCPVSRGHRQNRPQLRTVVLEWSHTTLQNKFMVNLSSVSLVTIQRFSCLCTSVPYLHPPPARNPFLALFSQATLFPSSQRRHQLERMCSLPAHPHKLPTSISISLFSYCFRDKLSLPVQAALIQQPPWPLALSPQKPASSPLFSVCSIFNFLPDVGFLSSVYKPTQVFPNLKKQPSVVVLSPLTPLLCKWLFSQPHL